MKNIKNIFFVFTSVLILLPSAVSFSHIFAQHSHDICDNYSEYHYHQESIDCDLHKFQKNPALQISFPEYVIYEVEFREKLQFDYYRFLNEFEPLPFDLRGPPQLA